MHPSEAWIEQISCQRTLYNQVEGDIGPLQQQIEEAVNEFT
jgi:hypothetical protein